MGTSQRSRLPALDPLRFLAGLAVVVYHFAYHRHSPPDLPWLELVARHGYLGVELFFIISGFVISWSAVGRSARQFATARVVRLYPEFWVAVLLSAIVFRAVPGGAGDALSIAAVAANLTMLPQLLGQPYVDGVYWTLFVEIKFYALAWILIVTGQAKHFSKAVGVWIALLLAIELGFKAPGLRPITLYPYGVYFAAGSVFFIVFKNGWNLPRALALVVCLALAIRHADRSITDFVSSTHVDGNARLITSAILLGMFVAFAAIVTTDVEMQDTSTVRLLGDLTYPLYLTHNVSRELFLVGVVSLGAGSAIPAALIAAIAIAYLVFFLGSRVISKRLRRILDRPLTRNPVVEAGST